MNISPLGESMLDLVKQLVDTTGVSQEQAEGGAGLLFKLAKDQLSSGDFSQLSESMPEVGNLVNAAPTGGLLGNLMGAFGGGKLAGLASLAGGFSKLGLDANMVSQFTPVILSFVQGKAGNGAADLLKGIFK